MSAEGKESSSSSKRAKPGLIKLHNDDGSAIEALRFVGEPTGLPLVMHSDPPLIQPNADTQSLVVSKSVFKQKFKDFTVSSSTFHIFGFI
jgi:hypothetical protein